MISEQPKAVRGKRGPSGAAGPPGFASGIVFGTLLNGNQYVEKVVEVELGVCEITFTSSPAKGWALTLTPSISTIRFQVLQVGLNKVQVVSWKQFAAEKEKARFEFNAVPLIV